MRAVLALAAAFSASAAGAAEVDRFDARGFWIADTSGDPWRPVRMAYPSAGRGWDAGLAVDLASEPLLEKAPGGPEPVVDAMAGAHLYGGLAWKGMRFEGAMPATLYGHDPGGSFAGTGDLRLGTMLPAWAPRGIRPGLGLQVSAWLPTGADRRWSGSPGPAAGAVVAIAQEVGRVGWTLNGGLRVGRSVEARNLSAGSGPVGGAEAHWRIREPMALGAGLVTQGATGFSSWPIEAQLQARYRLKGGGFAILGAARGVDGVLDAGGGVGSSAGRIFFGAGYGHRPPEGPRPPVVVPVMLAHTAYIRAEAGEVPLARLEDDKIVVTEQVFFLEAKADLLPESEPVLEAVRQVIEAHPEVQHLLVEGHTNSRGGARYNRRLSDARARAVVDWLVARGIDPDRILAKGFGETRPLRPDDSPDSMEVNRRVEFTVLRSDEEDGAAR